MVQARNLAVAECLPPLANGQSWVVYLRNSGWLISVRVSGASSTAQTWAHTRDHVTIFISKHVKEKFKIQALQFLRILTEAIKGVILQQRD